MSSCIDRFTFPHPECAVCLKPVDEVRRWVDTWSDVYVFEFCCHGSKERVELTSEWIENSTSGRLSLGQCFVSQVPALKAPVSLLEAPPPLLLESGDE